MNYTAILNGISYDLPDYSNKIKQSIQALCNEANSIDATPEMQEETSKKLFSYMKELLGPEASEEVFETDNFDEVDPNMVTICLLEVCNAYDKPVREKRMQELQQTIDNSKLDKIIETARAAETMQNANRQNRRKFKK